ncbi:hypothetical protein [Serratia fonticola]|uniref:hypothetical protein n=1 Tax=Serratia fonticola TaxID=47917 RepID=UPI000E0E0E7E|nr:hypothetical protein [Serratia fonticola]RDL13350.1 hypothetical protein DFO62_1379 [Serratia fonticola]
MNILHMVNTMEFKIALLRHYVAQAFMDAMYLAHQQPVYCCSGNTIALTPDRVSANIAYYIERANILDYGIEQGQAINAERLYSMLDNCPMTVPLPQLSAYGHIAMDHIYGRIARGGADGILPAEATVKILTGEVAL